MSALSRAELELLFPPNRDPKVDPRRGDKFETGMGLIEVTGHMNARSKDGVSKLCLVAFNTVSTQRYVYLSQAWNNLMRTARCVDRAENYFDDELKRIASS